MSLRRWLAAAGLLLLGGCTYGVREQADQMVSDLGRQRLDVSQLPTEPGPQSGGAMGATSDKQSKGPAFSFPTDVRTTALLGPELASDRILPVKYQGADPTKTAQVKIVIPDAVPGSETKAVTLPAKDSPELAAAVAKLYPQLPKLPEQPQPLPGPNGHPYTLAELQDIATQNSPALREAAFAVKIAEGNLIGAAAYPNPTVNMQKSPSNDGSTAGVFGIGFDQLVKTAGKQRLATAIAKKALENAQLALRRARSDLATQVRQAYFALLVAEEAMRVNGAMAQFTDEMLKIQISQVKVGIASAYEPAALLAQVYTMRLQYQQAIDAYVYAWKELVTAIGERQLPLTAVAGRADRAVPYFDYDQVLHEVLQNHTDMLTALNGIDAARFSLKLAQVTPWFPDVNVSLTAQKEFVVAPEQWVYSLQVGVPIPIWDQGKGQIVAAEGSLGQATEEPHRVELTLTNSLQTAYQNYKTNLEAVAYYRRYILPDLVRTYRGILNRRAIDPGWSGTNFGDLLAAQQALTSGVTTYLADLNTLWSSAVSVCDLLQTDDIFKFGQPKVLPAVPDLDKILTWPCPHPCGTPDSGPCPCGQGITHSTSNDLYPHFSFETRAPARGPAAACPATPVPMDQAQTMPSGSGR